MSNAAEVSCVWPARAVLGEGPCWDRRDNALMWVDIKGERLHALDLANGAQASWTPPARIFSLDVPPPAWTAPAGAARWFIGCTASGFCWIGVSDDGIVEHPIAHPEPGAKENRFNDGKAGPDGRYWAGTMDDGETRPLGALYAFSPDGSYARIDAGYVVSNGPAFSPDGRTLYHTDSAQRVIYAFDLDADGAVSGRRTFCQFSDQDGYPDGMTTDRAGNLWVAMWDGARLQKLSPAGERMGHIAIPAKRPTSCAFANDEQSLLYVTSAAIGAPPEDTLAGGLFRVDLR